MKEKITFDRIIIVLGILGIILIAAALIWPNKYKIYSSWLKISTSYEEDFDKANEYYLEGLEILMDLNTISLEKLSRSCEIYQFLDSKSNGNYIPEWREKVSYWHYDIPGKEQVIAKRKFSVSSTLPKQYWESARGKILKVLELWNNAFLVGGRQIKYAKALAGISFAACKPEHALKAWADYVYRFEEIEFKELVLKKKNWYKQKENISSKELQSHTLARLQYRQGLENFLFCFQIYQVIIDTSKNNQKSSYKNLMDFSPKDAEDVLKRIILFESNKNKKSKYSCLLAETQKKIAFQNYHKISLKKKSTLQLYKNSIFSYKQCLKKCDAYQSFESNLSIAELYFAIKDKTLAGKYYQLAINNKPDLQKLSPYFSYTWQNRLIKLKFNLE